MPLRKIYKPEAPLKKWRRRLLPYATTAILSAVALGLTVLLPSISEKPFFVFFFAATALCGWLYGWGPSMTSVGLNVVALIYFVLSPHSFRIRGPGDVSRLLVFAVCSVIVAALLAKLSSTQRSLQLVKERFKLAHEIARIWAWELDLPTGRILWSSAPSAGGQDVMFKEWFQRVHPADRDRVTLALQRSVETQRPYEIEFRMLSITGQQRWVSSAGEFYRGPHGEQRMVGVGIDISYRKQAEEAIELAARAQMAGDLAHQINNPPQSLVHALYILHERTTESELRHYADLAQSETQRVSHLVA